MSDLAIGGTGFAVLLVLIALRVPIGVAMLSVGMIGYSQIAGTTALLSFLKTEMYWRFSSSDLAVIPLFLMMGHFAARAGITTALFRAAAAWIGHLRGGLAMAAVGGCGAFATVSGSSLATAAMMGQVALPELRRYEYSGAFATGALAAGGTLGILIPPSIVLIIFAVMVEGNIVSLFQAGLIPGLLAAIGYLVAVAIVARIDPKAGPAGPRASRAERWKSLGEIWSVGVIFLVVMGGIYSGIFTPTEGAGVGSVATFLVAVTHGGMRLDGFLSALIETASTTAMIFLILLGASMFNAFLGFSQLPLWTADFFQNSGLSPYVVLIGMLGLYLVFGCVMDSLAMILITIPIFWPIVAALEFGLGPDELKLWFGIVTLMVVEIGLITPPIGLNVFVINSLAKDVPMLETFKGVVPFLISDAIRVALVVLFPGISLFLPSLLR
jgi:C4-dicarboxylate transporter DctM subunit